MKSLRSRLMLIMMLLVLLASIISGFAVEWLYASYVSDTTDADLRQAAHAARLAADITRWRTLLEPGGEQSAYHLENLRRLKVVEEEFGLAYAYVMVRNDDGVPIFIFDTENLDEDAESTFLLAYDDAPPEVAQAFTEGEFVISKRAYTDQWGTFRSAFLPVPDGKGGVAAVVGVDLNIKSLNRVYVSTLLALFAAIGLSVVLAGVLVFLMAGRVARPLRDLAGVADLVAAGDLRNDIRVKGRDEIGRLAASFANMSGRLNGIIGQIRDASAQVAGSSEQLAGTARQLAEGAQSQASTLEQTSAAVEELTASVEQVAGHAEAQAASVARTAGDMQRVRDTSRQVSRTLEAVSAASRDSIQRAQSGVEAVTRTKEAILAISGNAEQIAGIVTVIGEIADQTNLLALNAAIEAARAGEHGRGFAVVAEEVSKLADRSATSAKEIEALIRSSTRNVSSGVEVAQAALAAMDGIIGGARTTSDSVGALGAELERSLQALGEVDRATGTVAEMSGSISAATAEQNINAKQVAKAIENVNELTQSAASAAEEMSSATEQLTGLASQLQVLVEQFQLAPAGDRPAAKPDRAAPSRSAA